MSDAARGAAARLSRKHHWDGAGHYGVYARWEEFLRALV